MGRWNKIAALVVASSAAAVAGCLVDLDRQISCGDGFIDRLAGEECEPGTDTDLWMPICGEDQSPNLQTGDCDIDECKIKPQGDADPCAVCGNGILEGGEECDGDQFGETCKESGGRFSCRGPASLKPCTIDRSNCHCGDGVFQSALEECEWRYPCGGEAPDGFTCASVGGDCDPELLICQPSPFALGGETQLCTELNDGVEWGSGQLRPLQHCDDDCSWDTEAACSMCGNGEIDDDEQCDGDQEDMAAKRQYCEMACAQQPLSIALDCNAPCTDACEFDTDPEVIVDPDVLGCCVIREENCSVEFPCCPGLECRTVAVGSQLEQRCVP